MNMKQIKQQGEKKPKSRSRNPVAHFANEFNKAQTHRDRTKYRRKEKHPTNHY